MSTVTSAAAGHRADACDTLDDLAHEHFDRVVANTSLPERIATPATAAPQLTATMNERLRARGVDSLWSHQAAAVDALRAGRNVVVATGTASGTSHSRKVRSWSCARALVGNTRRVVSRLPSTIESTIGSW